ncbi:MAG: DUF4097 domain-containing protein [Clostridiales bacterium]|nr:DUF4097 domain-containing protein [Clostridiales bacterium]
MKKKTYILLLVVALCLLICLSSIGGGSSLFGGYTYENSKRYTAGGASISGRVNEMDISWIEGGVEVRYHDGDEIILEEEASGKLSRKTELHWYKDGHKLYVKYAASGSRSFKNLNKKLTVLLPENMEMDEVKISTVSADVDVQGLEGENMTFETVSGNIILNKLDADNLEIDTVSGSIRMEQARVEKLTADSTSGDMYFAFDRNPDSVTTNAVSGNVTISLPGDAGFRAELDSVSGDVNCSLPAAMDGRAYVGGNGECIIKADSVSGNLILQGNN